MTTADDTRLAMEGTIEALTTGDGSEPVVVNLGPQHHPHTACSGSR